MTNISGSDSSIYTQNGKNSGSSSSVEDYVDSLDHSIGLNNRKAQMVSMIEQAFKDDTVLMSVDVEAHEMSKDKVTEIGIAIYDPKEQGSSRIPFIQLSHIIISENQHRRNGKYVPDHVDFFNGGESLVLSQNDAVASINKVIDTYRDQGICIVGHDLRGDIKWLSSLGLTLPSKSLDTQRLLSLTHGKNGVSLKNGLRVVRQPFAFLHNAGNDAYYTLVLCLCLCEPIYRKSCGMDTATTISEFKDQKSTKRDPPNVSKRVQATSLYSLFRYLGRQSS